MPMPRREVGIDAPDTCGSVHGGTIDLAATRWELDGPDGAPVVVLLGGISADEHAVATGTNSSPGWWQDVVDAGAIDRTRYRILGVRFGTAGGAPTDTRDQVRVIEAALDRLGIWRVHAIVGGSYGGMVALAFAQHLTERVRRVVALCAAHESHPMATAGRVLQRRIVQLGQATGRSREALALARGMAITSYRSAHEFAERFANPSVADGGGIDVPVASYLEWHGARFARRFTAERFLALSESVDLHRVDPQAIRVPVTLVACTSDTLVPPWQVAALHRALPGSTFHEIDSRFGHDAFLKEAAALAPIIRDTLDGDTP